MELSVRAQHCLQRAGYKTIGDVVSGIDGKEDLLKIRSMGKLSANEVMVSLCCFQYSLLSEDGKERFVKRVLELNGV
jgi:DNA-directed RNA polymerase alpha subunit